MILLVSGLSFFATFLLLLFLLKGGLAKFALDHPNQRSLHTAPIPRVGGLALMAGAMIGLLAQGEKFGIVGAGAGMLVLVSLFDDIKGVPVQWRFLAHGLVTAGFLWAAIGVNDGIILLMILLFAVIWMINLYNFMDGSDGLAGGMALIGFGCYGVAAYLHGNGELFSVAMSIVASAFAFLLFNFHPAKVFMGDAGSIPLGFLAAALGILGWQDGIWSIWFPVMVFSPFIMDATVTLLKRLARGEKVWQAHREHYYQRLVQMGLGHRKTALYEYGLMVCVGASALWMLERRDSSQVMFLAAWLFVYVVLMSSIDRHWAAFKKN